MLEIAVEARAGGLADDLKILSASERERAARYRFDLDRARFIAARGATRRWLGMLLGRDPVSLRFCYGEYGKPALEDEAAIAFSVSHSGPAALIAVAAEGPIGVDVEARDDARQHEALLTKICSEEERAAVARSQGQSRMEAFYTCWTRKEAVLKALGTGIARDPCTVEVYSRPKEGAAVGWRDGGEGRMFTVVDLPTVCGESAALAVAGALVAVHRWVLPQGGLRE